MGGRALTAKRLVGHVLFGVVVVAFLLAISPGVGSQPIGVAEAWRHWGAVDSPVHYIAFQLRLPTTLKALLAGVTLSLAGAVYQTLFRNVLATPYTLGVASGGSLGALIAVKLGVDVVWLGFGGQVWCALAGCGVVLGLVFAIAGAQRRVTGNTLVLAGVTMGLFCSAMMMFMTYLANVRETFFIVRWMMGSLESVGHGQVARMLAPLAVSWLVLLCLARSLNQFELGDEIAASRGVQPARLQWVAVGFASLATACVVSLCGPIGFVGLIVPQAVRLIVGRDHRILLPVAGLWGGAFLIICDWLTRLLPVWYGAMISREDSSFPLPIGVMTAVIGAPVFVWLLWRRGAR